MKGYSYRASIVLLIHEMTKTPKWLVGRHGSVDVHHATGTKKKKMK